MKRARRNWVLQRHWSEETEEATEGITDVLGRMIARVHGSVRDACRHGRIRSLPAARQGKRESRR